MARGVSSWLESEESFIPEPDVFLDRLQHARREWSKPRPGPDATGPVRVLGRLTILLRYAPARRRAVLKPRLSAFKKAIAETIRDSREDFQRAVEHLLDYRLSVAEDIAERLSAQSPIEIRKQMSLVELTDEFLDFVEDAFLTLEGLRALETGMELSPWESRLNRLRTTWLRAAPVAAAAFFDDVTDRHLAGLRAHPPEYWWEHLLEDSIERR